MRRKGKLAAVLNKSTVAALLAGLMVISSFSAIAVSADLFSSGGKKDIIASSSENSIIEYDAGKVYFLNTADWATPKCHAWNASNESQNNGGWPGAVMTDTGKTYSGHKIYSCDLAQNMSMVIFNNNGSDKTPNLTRTANAVYIYSSKEWKDLKTSDEPIPSGYDYYAENGFYQDNIFSVDASYYDYLSDRERTNGWLHPIQAGTGFNGADNNWYPFWNFNSDISGYANGVSSWKYPLYFGNFCNTGRAYMGKNNDHGGYHNGSNDGNGADLNNTGYMQAINGLKRWDYFANNSNALTGYHYAVRGLAYDKLNNNNIQVAENSNMPYFDTSWLGNKAKKIKSYFPFRMENKKANDNKTDVTHYIFSSRQATDNVFFTWNSAGEPSTINYGAGKAFGIEDGYRYFMDSARPDYDDEDPYGIFPFNNNKATTNRPGNTNLDYGFGIKLDIDFRVPEDGLLAGNTPVMFKYSGDDDMWVYLTDDEGNSKLVLDLGGNHKLTEGELNFNTMKATSTKTSYYTDSSADLNNMLFIGDESDYPNQGSRWDKIYIKAWGGGGSEGWYELAIDEKNMRDGDSYPLYYACKDQVGTNGRKLSECTHFKLFGEMKNDSYYQTGTDISFSSIEWGKRYTLKKEKDNGKDFKFDTYKHSCPTLKDKNNNSYKIPYFTKKVDDFGFESSGSGFKTLDPNKTYHMTVFYMERGTLESNFEVEFTIIPVLNDFKLDKTVDVSGVNSVLQSKVESLDDFDFEVKSGSTLETVTQIGKKTYTHKSGETSTVKETSEGKLKLKDKESASFVNQFNRGDYLTVTETDNSKLSYTTQWHLTDNKNGTVTDSVGNSKESKFKLGKKTEYSNYSLGFVNKPKVGDLEVSKTVTKSGTDPLDDEFTVQVEIDVDGDGTRYSYNTYVLDCEKYDKDNNMTLTSLDADGTIKLKEDEKIIIRDLPEGSTYRVKETDIPAGFTAMSPAGITTGVEGTIDSTAVEVVPIVNKKPEGKTNLDVVKTLDYEAYNSADYGSKAMFKFDLVEVNADGSTKSGGETDNTKSSVAGKVTFKTMKFTSSGTYYYKITESNVSGRTEDYKMDTKAIFAKVVVSPSAGGFTFDTRYCKAAKDSTPSELTYSTEVDKKTFENITYGQLKITKANRLDGTGNAVPGTEIKGSEFELRDGSNTLIAKVATNSDGIAEFKNLPIKKSDGTYITYHVKEVKAPQPYRLSEKAKADFTFEGAANAEGTYTKGYAFVNPEIAHPSTGEVYSNNHLLVGGMLMLLSGLGGIVYLIYIKRRPKAEKFLYRKK